MKQLFRSSPHFPHLAGLSQVRRELEEITLLIPAFKSCFGQLSNAKRERRREDGFPPVKYQQEVDFHNFEKTLDCDETDNEDEDGSKGKEGKKSKKAKKTTEEMPCEDVRLEFKYLQEDHHKLWTLLPDESQLNMLYLAAFSTLGMILRVYTGRLMGLDCNHRYEEHNHTTTEHTTIHDVWEPIFSSICITHNGWFDESTRTKSVAGAAALFTDLPANMLGCLVMGLLLPQFALQEIPHHAIPWLSRHHRLQGFLGFHMALTTGFCGCIFSYGICCFFRASRRLEYTNGCHDGWYRHRGRVASGPSLVWVFNWNLLSRHEFFGGPTRSTFLDQIQQPAKNSQQHQ